MQFAYGPAQQPRPAVSPAPLSRLAGSAAHPDPSKPRGGDVTEGKETGWVGTTPWPQGLAGLDPKGVGYRGRGVGCGGGGGMPRNVRGAILTTGVIAH